MTPRSAIESNLGNPRAGCRKVETGFRTRLLKSRPRYDPIGLHYGLATCRRMRTIGRSLQDAYASPARTIKTRLWLTSRIRRPTNAVAAMTMKTIRLDEAFKSPTPVEAN